MKFYGTSIKKNCTQTKLLPVIYIENNEYYIQLIKDGRIAGFNNINTYSQENQDIILRNLHKIDLKKEVFRNIKDNAIYTLFVYSDEKINTFLSLEEAFKEIMQMGLHKFCENIAFFINNAKEVLKNESI